MHKICFVCLGNICRSPMAEFMMKNKIRELGLEKKYHIESRATSYEEDGNDMYPPAKRMLSEMNISYTRHRATRLEKSDYDKFDVFYCMEDANISNALRIFQDDAEKKVKKLLNRDISDPWYTGNFLSTYNDLEEGINQIIVSLEDK